MLTKEDLLSFNGAGKHTDQATLFEVERHLYREARLLDDEDLRGWYDLLADDLIYWVPIRENHLRKHRKPELVAARCALFDETKDTINTRLLRNESGMCWTEDPPTRHVYSVSNIEAFETNTPDEFEVHSVFTLYRSRFERDDSTLMGRRKDIFRRAEEGFHLAGRLVLLQQSTLMAKNLNVFF
jgi:ethylbenzene dioxygenase beta subunit